MPPVVCSDRAVRRRALVEALETEARRTSRTRQGSSASPSSSASSSSCPPTGPCAWKPSSPRWPRSARRPPPRSLAAPPWWRRPRPPARRPTRAFESFRTARREAERAADGARREAARIGADLAGVNQFLRSQAGAPGGARALGDGLRARPGFELALAAVLGPRLRAAVADDLPAAKTLLEGAGRDGGAALVPSTRDVSGAGAPTYIHFGRGRPPHCRS